MPLLNGVAQVYVNSTILNFNLCKEIDKPHSYMPNIHSIIVASSSANKTPGGPHFLEIVFPVRWFNRLVKNMFQYQLAFFNYVNPLSIVSMAFFKSSLLQLPLGPISCLVTLTNFCHGCDSS